MYEWKLALRRYRAYASPQKGNTANSSTLISCIRSGRNIVLGSPLQQDLMELYSLSPIDGQHNLSMHITSLATVIRMIY
mgnify:CR=1 FL=1|jgi:hypothetical protein